MRYNKIDKLADKIALKVSTTSSFGDHSMPPSYHSIRYAVYDILKENIEEFGYQCVNTREHINHLKDDLEKYETHQKRHASYKMGEVIVKVCADEQIEEDKNHKRIKLTVWALK